MYDHFVNAAGNALEQGDVVVLNPSAPVGYYGSGDSIPIPEVDAHKPALRSANCGVVVGLIATPCLADGVRNRMRSHASHTAIRWRSSRARVKVSHQQGQSADGPDRNPRGIRCL